MILTTNTNRLEVQHEIIRNEYLHGYPITNDEASLFVYLNILISPRLKRFIDKYKKVFKNLI
jgi:hypothetical protein